METPNFIKSLLLYDNRSNWFESPGWNTSQSIWAHFGWILTTFPRTTERSHFSIPDSENPSSVSIESGSLSTNRWITAYVYNFINWLTGCCFSLQSSVGTTLGHAGLLLQSLVLLQVQVLLNQEDRGSCDLVQSCAVQQAAHSHLATEDLKCGSGDWETKCKIFI